MTREERIKILTDALAIDSTNKNEELVAKCYADYFKEAGIESKLVNYAETRSNLVAEFGTEDGPVFAVSGHLDVVPAGDESKWTTPPFTPTERDGRIFARGATDMKSGTSAMVAAMIELKNEGFAPKGRIRFMGTVGEETTMAGATQLTKEGYASDVEALIIGEPTGHQIGYAHKGVFNYTVNSYGKSAHSSTPELGVNAIDNLIMFYNRMMEEFAKLDEENAVLGKTVFCNSIINGGAQFNIVPEFASMTANLRTIPEVDNDRITGILSGIVSELNDNVKNMKLELVLGETHIPVFSDVNSKLVQIAVEEGEKAFDEKPPVLGGPGATDAAEFLLGNRAMQIIIFGPGNDTMHQTDEYVETENYLEMIDVYKNIIKRYFA